MTSHEIYLAHASSTTETIARIAALCAIEAEIRGSTPDIRKATRQARAKPLLDIMCAGLEAKLEEFSRKSETVAVSATGSHAGLR